MGNRDDPRGQAASPPYIIDRGNPLTRGLVFALGGASTRDAVSGTEAIATGVTRIGTAKGPATKYAGGSVGASDLNFGTYAATADLHESPATWAFLASTTDTTKLFLASHTDNNSDRGWEIGYQSYSGQPGAVFVRAGSNIVLGCSLTIPTTRPFTYVLAGDGALAMSATFYVDGIADPETDTGAGSTGAATSENLYIGRSRFQPGGSLLGTVNIALIWNRKLSAAEVRAWNADPWQVFVRRSSAWLR